MSGRGGIRGYATKGTHRDPTSNLLREATPWDPILVAGGGVGGVNEPETMFMHNSWRPTNRYVQADGVERGNILIGTEEEFNDDCASDGRLVVSDLTDSWGGEPALNSTPEAPYRMKPLDTWHPAQDTPGTTSGDASCSAHYFELRKSTLAQAWYAAGPAADRRLGREERAADRLLARVHRRRRPRTPTRGTSAGAATTSTCST